MLKKFSTNGGSAFRIKRPLITTSGFVSDVDATVKFHLDELNSLLSRRIIHPDLVGGERSHGLAGEEDGYASDKSAEVKRSSSSDKNSPERIVRVSDLAMLLQLPLTPKLIPDNKWNPKSLAAVMSIAKESNDGLTLSEYIDTVAELSSLKYAFEGELSTNWATLDFNTKAVLDERPALRDYLVAYANLVQGLEEDNGLYNFILNNRLGVRNIANYALVSAARSVIDAEQIKVANYNNDSSEIVDRVKSAGLSLAEASFKPKLKTLLKDFIFNSDELDLLDKAKIGPVPASLKPLLVKYIQNSPVPVDVHNINNWLPLFVSQASAATKSYQVEDDVDLAESEKDFTVELFEEENASIQVSRSAVYCAAQLYYAMVMDLDLDIFSVVDYFTRKYLLRGGMEITDRRLRDDLQSYVFSNRFKDKQNKVVDRTRPAERQMFYRQVFDYGKGVVPADTPRNTEHPQLMKVLIFEAARYLQRAQASPHPDSYVSRQNVSQAVEDLQYNLSVHSTGMVNVITPLINAEIDFIIRRFFMHPEVIRQVAPQGGTWWRVVENLYLGMRNARLKATVLYNKARLGYSIIRSIADYDSTVFEDDENFSAFISQVDLFITTQSALQKATRESLPDEETDHEDAGQEPALMPVMANGNGSQPEVAQAGGDEWDF